MKKVESFVDGTILIYDELRKPSIPSPISPPSSPSSVDSPPIVKLTILNDGMRRMWEEDLNNVAQQYRVKILKENFVRCF